MTASSFDDSSTPTTDLDLSVYERKLLGRFDRRILGSPYARWVLGIVVAGLLVSSSVQFFHKIHQTEQTSFRESGIKHRTAVGRWLPDARALVDGEDPYGVGHWFPNPPLVLMILVPLAYLPLSVAAVLWAVFKIAAVVGACWLLARSARKPGIGIPLGVMVMAAVFSARPIMADITHGNINIFVFFEIALAWYLFVNHRDLLAGVVVALAIATKITPALLLAYFLYKRSWRVVAGTAIGLLLFVLMIPTLILGFDRNIDLLADWTQLMIEPFVTHGFVTVELKNQSLGGALTRMLAYLGVVELQHITLEQQEVFGILQAEMARPATMWGRILLRAITLIILLLLAWLCRSPNKDRRDPRLLLELSLILLAMLLLSERTWKHHLTTLPIIYLGTWLVLACCPWPKRFTALFVVGLIFQFLLLVVIKGDKMLYLGVITIALVLCFAQNAILLRRMNAKRVEVPP